jgi:hypothetical protein
MPAGAALFGAIGVTHQRVGVNRQYSSPSPRGGFLFSFHGLCSVSPLASGSPPFWIRRSFGQFGCGRSKPSRPVTHLVLVNCDLRRAHPLRARMTVSGLNMRQRKRQPASNAVGNTRCPSWSYCRSRCRASGCGCMPTCCGVRLAWGCARRGKLRFMGVEFPFANGPSRSSEKISR